MIFCTLTFLKMGAESIWDTPELIAGQISALKLLGFTDRDVATQIIVWGFKISHRTVSR
jgi:hypothetical protein